MGKLGIYLVANYPSKEVFLRAVGVCRESGVDFLEVGFPFSDPSADGPLLEKASQEVLKQYGINDFIESFQEARALFGRRIYIMTYANMVYGFGAGRFAQKVGPCAGLILADLPLREIPMFEKELQGSINLIRFLTPESRSDDMASALKRAKDFIYFVSKRGTTGGAFSLDDETREMIGRIRGKGVDVYIGFGIQGKDDLDAAFAAADGAIIGTKAVGELEHGVDRFQEFLGSLQERT